MGHRRYIELGFSLNIFCRVKVKLEQLLEENYILLQLP